MAQTLLEIWHAAGRSYRHHGHEIFYREEGSGPALLLIHGFPTASWDWRPIWATLAARYRLIAPDMIGFGFSAKPRDYPYSILDQADLYEGLLESLGVKQVHVLAHDYGDTVAQELLARHNARQADGKPGLKLRSVCFLNGGLFPEAHRPRLVQKLLISPLGPLLARFMNERGFGRSFSAVFGPKTQPSPEELKDFWHLVAHNDGTRVFPKLIRYMVERRQHRERWVGALQNAKIPLRVIDGSVDPVSGRHMVERYRELVPNPDTVLLEGIGHYPQVEHPQGVLDAYLPFVTGARGGQI
ncbi:MAG: alpha/beta fold hydrolase [Nevskiales bacterium]